MMIEVQGPQKLGPLTPLVGEWEGNVGVDVSLRHRFRNIEDQLTTTNYFERAWFKPIPTQQNGLQFLEGLKYEMTAWRHGEEAMDPFHDEVGYLLWDQANKQVMRTVAFGRGIVIQAGSSAERNDQLLHFDAKAGDPNYGILQNKHLSQKADIISFEGTFEFNEDDSLSYDQTLVMDIEDFGGQMAHTDRNTLHKVKRYHPSQET